MSWIAIIKYNSGDVDITNAYESFNELVQALIYYYNAKKLVPHEKNVYFDSESKTFYECKPIMVFKDDRL